jgi:HK97 family phage portal protein
MGLFTALRNLFRPRADITSLTMEQWAKLISENGGGVALSGVTVSPESALRFATVQICVRVLSESVASLPLILYRRRADGGRDRATDHPLYPVLHDLANGWNTAFELVEGTMHNLATRGNGYAYVERNGKGQTIGLIPLNPDGVTIEQATDWSPVYTATMPNNVVQKLRPREMHHVRGPFPKGYVGRSMIALARDGIGLGMAAEEFGSKLFANGAQPNAILKHPAVFKNEGAVKRLREQFAENATGLRNAGKPIILEEGMEWVATTINPTDAQYIELRKMQRSEIAGVFRVPAHMVNDLERATFSNIEHQSLAFVVYSLIPWLRRWEQAINRDLLTPSERGEYFAEFLVDGLLRGDFKTRMEGYALAIQNGINNPNEIRIKENQNPREGGDEYWKPSNMMGDQAQAQATVAALMPTTRKALLAELKRQIDDGDKNAYIGE